MSETADLRPFGYAPGDYMVRCRQCNKQTFGADKRAIACRPCAEKRMAEYVPPMLTDHDKAITAAMATHGRLISTYSREFLGEAIAAYLAARTDAVLMPRELDDELAEIGSDASCCASRYDVKASHAALVAEIDRRAKTEEVHK